MSDVQTPEEKEAQTLHVLQVANGNLSVVIDQLESLDDSRVKNVLKTLHTAKPDLDKLITP